MRVKQLQTNFNVRLRYRHFPLHPDTPPEGLTLEDLFAGRNIDIPAAQTQLQHRMQQEGLPYGNRTHTFNTRLAQELAKWAERETGELAIHDALYQAYFVNNVNLADIDNLVEITHDFGLPGDKARAALTTGRFRTAVDADWERSRLLGVTSVPTFVTGKRALVGAQSYEDLATFLQAAGARPRTPPAHSNGPPQP